MNKKDYRRLAKKLNDFELEIHEEFGWFTTQEGDTHGRIILDEGLYGLPIPEYQELWMNDDTSKWYLQRENGEWILQKDNRG